MIQPRYVLVRAQCVMADGPMAARKGSQGRRNGGEGGALNVQSCRPRWRRPRRRTRSSTHPGDRPPPCWRRISVCGSGGEGEERVSERQCGERGQHGVVGWMRDAGEVGGKKGDSCMCARGACVYVSCIYFAVWIGGTRAVGGRWGGPGLCLVAVPTRSTVYVERAALRRLPGTTTTRRVFPPLAHDGTLHVDTHGGARCAP